MVAEDVEIRRPSGPCGEILETDDGEEHWVARDNFYAIMRYNPRTKYAMAVYQLSEAIRQRYRDGAG